MKALICLFRVALICTVIFAQIAAAPAPKASPYDVNSYIHPQQLVDVGGRRLNLICSGKGSPTVILEAGLLADASAWRDVQPAIAHTTRVCSYDRAGFGFSDPAGAPRDPSAIVRDLHTLLTNAGIAGPYVLVGWSSGGLYTRLYQYRYPHDVVGLVEVDPDSEFNPPNYGEKIVLGVMHQSSAWYEKQIHDWYKQYDNCAANVSRGSCDFFPGLAKYRQLLRAKGCPAISPDACAISEVRAEHFAKPSLWKDGALEVRATKTDPAEVGAVARRYGDLPLIVLTDSEDGDIDNEGPISVAAQRAEWVAKNAAEERLARLSDVGAHFVIAGSSHAILLDHPAAVISAIDEVLSQARGSASKPLPR